MGLKVTDSPMSGYRLESVSVNVTVLGSLPLQNKTHLFIIIIIISHFTDFYKYIL